MPTAETTLPNGTPTPAKKGAPKKKPPAKENPKANRRERRASSSAKGAKKVAKQEADKKATDKKNSVQLCDSDRDNLQVADKKVSDKQLELATMVERFEVHKQALLTQIVHGRGHLQDLCDDYMQKHKLKGNWNVDLPTGVFTLLPPTVRPGQPKA